ncbi:hypothetical protein [Adhaeribacter terreus]|uniref:DUF4239 domain-containing protein n=1 Tax=Adhaeribacter terreus TaxID=529703 RepID=A0ABW0EAQ6_9BACT
MDVAKLITSLPSWVLFGLIVAFCILCAEAGAWLGQYRVNKGIKEPEAPVGTAVGAMLGLLAFMLAFTFSFTADRFGSRKELAIRHANAISTCYVRASMIPEKQKMVIRENLKKYIAISFSITNAPPEKVAGLVAQLEKLQLVIWRQTASLKNEDMDSELRTYFCASVNDLMEVARERKTVSLVFNIPSMLWTSLLFLTAVSMFAIGYQTGNYGKRRILDLPLLATGFALVVVLIADMDSSRTNGLRVSLQPLKDVQKMMQEDIP